MTPPNEFDEADEYILLDNGQGADIQSGDGIYSRYMTRYPSTGRYSVKAQVGVRKLHVEPLQQANLQPECGYQSS